MEQQKVVINSIELLIKFFFSPVLSRCSPGAPADTSSRALPGKRDVPADRPLARRPFEGTSSNSRRVDARMARPWRALLPDPLLGCDADVFGAKPMGSCDGRGPSRASLRAGEERHPLSVQSSGGASEVLEVHVFSRRPPSRLL